MANIEQINDVKMFWNYKIKQIEHFYQSLVQSKLSVSWWIYYLKV